MKQYELVVLLHPDLEIDIDAPVKKIEKLISAGGGKITKRENWGKKRFAYKVKKQQFGVYVFFEIDMDPSKVRSLESSLLITDEVLRFLTVNRLEAPPVKEVVAGDDNKPVTAATAAATKES